MNTFFVIFKIGNALQAGRVIGAHNLNHDNIIAGPFSSHSAAMQVLCDLRGSEYRRAA